MAGWIKLYRQLLDWEWFDNSKMVHIFLYFLLQANTEDKEWHGLIIRRGQFATAVATISKATGLSSQEIRTCIKRLVKAGQIVYDSTNRATHRCIVITICNYDKYQDSHLNDNKPDNKQTTNKPSSPRSEDSRAEQPEPQADGLNEEQFLDFFNQEMEANKAIIPKIHSLGKTRRTHLRARFREHGMAALEQMVRNAARSDFLNGKNNRGWKATFDWLLLPANFPKVVEGSYENITIQTNNYPNYGTLQKDRYALRRPAEPAACCPEAYTDTF